MIPIRTVFIRLIKKIIKYSFKLLPAKNTLVFESEGDYSDNCYAFYKYLVDNNYNQKYKLVWFVTDPSLYSKHVTKNVAFVKKFGSVGFYYYLNTAKYIFFTHPYWLTSWKKTQTVINFWHGVILKHMKSDQHMLYNYLVISSDNLIDVFCENFLLKNNQCLVLGTPRLDLLFSKKNIVINGIDICNYKKVFLCMPTFKKTKNWIDSYEDNCFYINTINSLESLKALNSKLKDNNCFMIVKIHHLQLMDSIKSDNLSNIVYLTDDDLLNNGIQLYELLACSDALLTDFSSVYFDYLLLNNQIGFFANSIKEYSRGFLVDNPQEYMPGQKIYNNLDLYSFIDNVVNNNDNYSIERKRVLDSVDQFQDSMNCERIAKYFGL